MVKNENSDPRSPRELLQTRSALLAVRPSALAILNELDKQLGVLDEKIDLAKKVIGRPAARCRYCGAMVLFKRVNGNWHPFELDGAPHSCLEAGRK